VIETSLDLIPYNARFYRWKTTLRIRVPEVPKLLKVLRLERLRHRGSQYLILLVTVRRVGHQLAVLMQLNENKTRDVRKRGIDM
jgi:hypothetical protein